MSERGAMYRVFDGGRWTYFLDKAEAEAFAKGVRESKGYAAVVDQC